MVEVVFQKVVFWQVGDVAGLDGGEERDVRWVGAEGDDVDHGFCFGRVMKLSGIVRELIVEAQEAVSVQ